MARKSSQLQIRVSAEQKRRIKQLARAASLDVSTWVLTSLLPDDAERFQVLTAGLAERETRRFAFAELADFLQSLPPAAFARAVSRPPRERLDVETLNYLAAALDRSSRQRGQPPPPWTSQIPPVVSPQFGSALTSVRLHLLTHAPVAMRRRNIFVDASIDDRV